MCSIVGKGWDILGLVEFAPPVRMNPSMADNTVDNEKTSLLPVPDVSRRPTKRESVRSLPSLWEDALDTFRLGVPIFLSRLSFVGMKTTDTALLGHVNRDALSAAALSDLWTMCSTVFITGRVLGVLVGGAVGANNHKLAGIYLQVSLFVLSILALVVFICWNITEQVWLAFGSDPLISSMAGYYARVLSLSIPAVLAFGQLAQFFSAQRIMTPEVVASTGGLLMNLFVGLLLVLGIGIPGWSGFQFKACPIVTASVSYVQFLGLFVYACVIKRLHIPCWDGWSWREITWPRIKTFSELYFPAAMSSASDFWRVAVIGAVAANLGEEEVAVFNTSYRIMWIALIFVGSLAGASSINMSLRLGNMDPFGARQAGYVGIAMATCMLMVFSGAMVWNSQIFGRIFTNDVVFLEMFDDAVVPFSLTLFMMNLAVAIERIPYSMGRTTAVFWMGFVASWGGQVPAVMLCTSYWRHDLYGLYTGMAIGYAILVVLYSVIAFRSDWHKYAAMAVSRSEGSAK